LIVAADTIEKTVAFGALIPERLFEQLLNLLPIL
jgi:hypothetical protein